MCDEIKDLDKKELNTEDIRELTKRESEGFLEENQSNEATIEEIGVATKVNDMDALLFETPPGGIMTREVGTITGPVELFIEDEKARIRYEGALDVYTVPGEVNGRSLQEIAQVLTTDPGIDEYGNANFTSLITDDSEESMEPADDDGVLLEDDGDLEEPADDDGVLVEDAETADVASLPSYVCILCGYIYDPSVGDPDNGVLPGTAFEDIPEDWVCPLCGASKDEFEMV